MFFDKIRKKFITKTPEETVRQKIIDYFIKELGYPANVFSIEREIDNSPNKKYRTDVVIYDKKCNPFILIECKAENVTIDKNALLQTINYNKYVNAKYVVISNLITTYCWIKENDTYKTSEIPPYNAG